MQTMNNTLVADTLVEPTEPMMIKIPEIPQELQLPLVVAVGLIGFLFVIAMSRLSAKKETTVELEASADSTPVKKSPRKKRSTPLAKKTGTVMTPAGRRSARIAASSTKKPRRKED